MAQVITVSLDDETAELIDKLKANGINVSDAIRQALIAYWKRRVKKDGTIQKIGE